MPVWIQQHVAPGIGGFRIPVPWYQSITSLFSILGVPLLFWIWRWQASHGREPDDLAKIGIGAWLASASNLILVAAIFVSSGAPIHPIWPFLCALSLGISFLYYWPTLLALVSQAAPPLANATLMGIAYLSLGISNIWIGWIGSLYERKGPASFWALHAGIAALGGLSVVVFGHRLGRALQTA